MAKCCCEWEGGLNEWIHVVHTYLYSYMCTLYDIRACVRKGKVLLWMRGERNECIHVARIYMWTYLHNTCVCERNGKVLLWMRGGLNKCIHAVRIYVYLYMCTYLYNTRKQTSRSLHTTCSRLSGMRPSSAPSSRTDVIMSGVMGCVCMYACIDVLVHESYIQTGNRYTHIYNWIQTNWHVYPTNICGQHIKLDILSIKICHSYWVWVNPWIFMSIKARHLYMSIIYEILWMSDIRI